MYPSFCHFRSFHILLCSCTHTWFSLEIKHILQHIWSVNHPNNCLGFSGQDCQLNWDLVSTAVWQWPFVEDDGEAASGSQRWTHSAPWPVWPFQQFNFHRPALTDLPLGPLNCSLSPPLTWSRKEVIPVQKSDLNIKSLHCLQSSHSGRLQTPQAQTFLCGKECCINNQKIVLEKFHLTFNNTPTKTTYLLYAIIIILTVACSKKAM